MESIGRSVQGKLRALGNFARSLKVKPDADIKDPKDVLIPSGEAAGEKEWTVLVYAEGRNRLAFSTNLALNKMEHLGSDSNVNIVAQATVEPTFFERFAPGMERVSTRRYYITKDADKASITSPVTGELEGRVPLNPETLADFLSWGMQKFPAKHYMVIIKKHGLGFAKTDKTVPLSARELRQALEATEKKTGKSVDVVSFDSCSMEQLEVASELKDHAKVMTASQEDIYAVDYPYDRVLWGLEQNPGMSPREAGDLVVRAHRDGVPHGIQTAVDLKKIAAVESDTRAFVEALISEGVPREAIYTAMLRSSSIEPGETMRFAFNFRDARGFIDNILKDGGTPPAVKSRGVKLKESLTDAIIAHHIGDGKKRLKDGTGFSLYMPWNAPGESMKESYEKLAFAQESSWMRLIDYVFESHDVAAAAAAGVKAAKEAEKNGGSPAQKLSLPRRLGKGLIKNYKQYVSPYLMTACKHTPSCSQYGREAIEKHGLIQGSKMAFMRILSCNDRAEGRYDPVPDVPGPGEPLICKGDHGPAPASMLESNLPQAVLTPPRPVEKSRMRRAVERCLISAGELTGKALGGALCALAALPLGAAMGTIIGARAGTDRIDDMNRSLSKTYSIDSVRQFLKIEHALGDPAYKTFRFVRDLTSSETAAKIVGGAVGVTTGFLLGAAGGAVTGLRWGKRFAGLFGENFVKDMLGELPKNPAAETVLRNFYGK